MENQKIIVIFTYKTTVLFFFVAVLATGVVFFYAGPCWTLNISLKKNVRVHVNIRGDMIPLYMKSRGVLGPELPFHLRLAKVLFKWL